jgi:hypothetical protein
MSELLGDKVEQMLDTPLVNKIKNEIERLTGQPCNCGNLKARINRLHERFKKLTGQEYGTSD